MKKKIIFGILLLLCPLTVFAENIIYRIDMNIDILQDGTANITEVWDVDGSDGTEWYKVMNNLGNSTLSNFKVSMDGKKLTYKNWNIDESLNQKKGYYGINYTYNGQELCFGKYDYNRHKFTLTYTLSNFVFNTSDSQVLYWKLIDELSDVDFQDFSLVLSSYYEFPDTLDVWGYGYKGYAYVEDGKIKMSNEDEMNGDYIVLLAKFPLNTFTTTNTNSSYNSFNDVLNQAEEGTFDYDYGTDDSSFSEIIGIIAPLSPFIIIFILIIFKSVVIANNRYGYKNNKIINKKEVSMFRDVPCNKDIYYANSLIKLNNFGYNESNILGAIILKWVRNNKVVFRNVTNGIFNKETSTLDLTLKPTFDNQNEQKLFDMMYVASKDGILETKELEKWCRSNYSKFLNLFNSITNDKIKELKNNNQIYARTSKEECKYKNIMSDVIYDDSVKLYGLKKFLEEFSRIDTKEVMEVHLWDEYLMFAYLFGIADKVAKQLKNLYPEVLEQANLDYDTILFVNLLSNNSVSAASSARSAAQSYSGGGGGFSSGGGGGGSSGGGGGGSR